jgi:hypothetical protein
MITTALLALIALPPSEVPYTPKLRLYQDGDQYEYRTTVEADGRQVHKPSTITVAISETSLGNFESVMMLDDPIGSKFKQDSKTGNVTITGQVGGFELKSVKIKSASLDGKVKDFSCYTNLGVTYGYKTKEVRYAGREWLELGFAKVECAKYKYTYKSDSPFKGDIATIWFNPTIGVNVKEIQQQSDGTTYTYTLTSTNALR